MVKSNNRKKLLQELSSLLAPRELEVYALLVQGCSSIEILKELNNGIDKPLTIYTVRTYISNVLKKLRFHSKKEAIRDFYERGFNITNEQLQNVLSEIHIAKSLFNSYNCTDIANNKAPIDIFKTNYKIGNKSYIILPSTKENWSC
jgi:DNA-binding CsgD family transcriptional regulator